MRINRNQAGDTLVEVMLAIAVIGMVIGASYATASRALRTGRFAQEQTEALKLAESQVEQLKYLASTSVLPGSANDIFNGAAGQNRFCIRDNDSFTKVLATSSADYTSYCRLRSGLYDILVEYTASENLFRINIDWERTGATNGAVQVSYKLFR
jgi:prepilin-type N-terminal cleavage/methylation domain-containing protein